jgi:hypothetical protein
MPLPIFFPKTSLDFSMDERIAEMVRYHCNFGTHFLKQKDINMDLNLYVQCLTCLNIEIDLSLPARLDLTVLVAVAIFLVGIFYSCRYVWLLLDVYLPIKDDARFLRALFFPFLRMKGHKVLRKMKGHDMIKDVWKKRICITPGATHRMNTTVHGTTAFLITIYVSVLTIRSSWFAATLQRPAKKHSFRVEDF